MSPLDQSNGFSPLRQKLSSFDHALRTAQQLRGQTGIPHYVVHGVAPLQSFKVTMRPPAWPDRWLAMVA
jgi:hypothetical protein